MDLDRLWDTLAERRNSARTAQHILEAASLPVEMPDASPSEAWWHAQGRAEAFAEVMTLLEQAGADRPILVIRAS